MSNATTTVAGDIQLAGDLAGNNNGAAPALTNTAVTPGSYTLGSFTVDSKGRLTAASNATSLQITSIIPKATTTTTGIVQIGSGLSVTAGVVSLNAPIATASSLGLMQVGAGLSVSSGVVSLNAPIATASSLGLMQVGSGLSVSAGVVSTPAIPNATGSSLGLMQVGSGLSVTGGVVSLNAPVATGSSTGVVQIGSGLSVTGGGVVSAVTGTSATKGIVNSANTSNITITAGAINVGPNVALLNSPNTFTKAQYITPTALTFGASIAIDASASNIFTLTMTGNGALANPTNLGAGRYRFIITQDATGSRTLTYGSAFKFAVGAVTTLSTAANAVDILTCVSDGTNLYSSLAKAFV